jgi:hypothetical protein
MPWPVNLARIVLLLEGSTLVGLGLAVAASSITTRLLGYLLLGGMLVAVAGLGVWSAAALGSLTKQSREVGLALALVGLLLGLYLLFRIGQSSLLPGLGVILVVANGTVILGLDSTKTQGAFRASADSERRLEAASELPSAITGAGDHRFLSASAVEIRSPLTSPRRVWLAAVQVLLVSEGAFWLGLAAWQLAQVIWLPTLLPGGRSGCGCAGGFGFFVGLNLALNPAVRVLACMLAAAALLGAGAATWAAVALGRASRAAGLTARLLAWTGVAVGLAASTIGMSNSNPASLAEGMALIAVNAVIISYAARYRRHEQAAMLISATR